MKQEESWELNLALPGQREISPGVDGNHGIADFIEIHRKLGFDIKFEQK